MRGRGVMDQAWDVYTACCLNSHQKQGYATFASYAMDRWDRSLPEIEDLLLLAQLEIPVQDRTGYDLRAIADRIGFDRVRPALPYLRQAVITGHRRHWQHALDLLDH